MELIVITCLSLYSGRLGEEMMHAPGASSGQSPHERLMLGHVFDGFWNALTSKLTSGKANLRDAGGDKTPDCRQRIGPLRRVASGETSMPTTEAALPPTATSRSPRRWRRPAPACYMALRQQIAILKVLVDHLARTSGRRAPVKLRGHDRSLTVIAAGIVTGEQVGEATPVPFIGRPRSRSYAWPSRNRRRSKDDA